MSQGRSAKGKKLLAEQKAGKSVPSRGNSMCKGRGEEQMVGGKAL